MRRWAFIAIAVTLAAANAFSAVWYVDKDNTAGPWNGTSWATTYRPG